MNKYDATNAMSSGTSPKMSMDMQQTANNENSVKAGSDVQQYEKKGLTHEGTTFIRNQDGELLRMTGNFKQTGGAWNFDGNVQNLTTGETFKGNMSGMTKDMNSMQQGLNVDDISMTGKERANLGDVKGKDVAFMQGTVVDSNLSASDVKHEDTIRTANDIDQNNKIKEAKTVDDTSTTINAGTKVDIGNSARGDTTALAMVKKGLSTYTNDELMKESFIGNMTSYQNSIMSEQGKNQLSLDKAFGIAGGASGSVGGKIFGTGLQASVSAELSARASENSGQISSADLNRVMNSAILEQLDADAKANNWTAEQYDQAARERFEEYNNYLKEQAGQSFGPSDSDLAPIEKAEELGQKTEQVVNKLLK